MRHLKLRIQPQRGFTLVELMVGIAIAAAMLKVGAPFFGDYVVNSRLREGGNLMFTEALVAQSEAVKRNTRVRLSSTGSTLQVLDMSVPATPVVLRERTFNGAVTAPVGTLDFGSNGQTVPFGTSLAANLGSSGVTCSSDLRCPGLRVDAGGAIRLCGNYLSGCV